MYETTDRRSRVQASSGASRPDAERPSLTRRASALTAGALAGVCACAWAAPPGSAPDSAGEWTMLGRSPEQHHYSPLSAVNASNVKRLGLAWHADLPTADGLLANPLVADGLVYQIGAFSHVWALDVRTGRTVWSYDPKVQVASQFASMWSHHLNRGVALWEDRVIFGTSDCRLIALNRRTGALIWDVRACESDGTRAINGAPRVGGGKVFIGNSDVDTGIGRGSMDAYDIKTGKHLWRFYTIPGDPSLEENHTRANQIAAPTWEGDQWWKSAGGGSTWEGITYDPLLNRVYFGVDGPSPWNASKRRGDNLFTESVVAVDANTGAYLWHYQTVPNDTWDLNDCSPIVIAELPVAGKNTRVLMHAPKNGFFYLLEASSGRLLAADMIGHPTWASKIDLATGRPVENPQARYYATHDKRAMVNPGPVGIHNWHAMSFSESTRLIYLPLTDVPVLYAMWSQSAALGGDTWTDYYAGMSDPKVQHRMGRLVAWDPVAKKEVWGVPLEVGTNGGVLSTAGNLVFEGNGTGEFAAYRADSGEKLWSYKSGSAIQAAPSTVEIDGQQLILVAVGDGGGIGLSVPRYSSTMSARGPSRLLAFRLGGTDSMSTTSPPIVFPKPPAPKPDSAQVEKGKALYTANACDYCHGPGAERWTMSVPDLRRASESTHAEFLGIVIGGARESKGMPRFRDMSVEDGEAIRAFILERAWAAYDLQQQSPAPRKAND
jgi:PQQ-dependent dehydrogenase (methanol/ethanol family)